MANKRPKPEEIVMMLRQVKVLTGVENALKANPLDVRLLGDFILVPVTKLCAWFDVPPRTVYYKPMKSPPKLDGKFVQSIKALIEG